MGMLYWAHSIVMSLFITALFTFDLVGHSAIYQKGNNSFKDIIAIFFQRGNLIIWSLLFFMIAFFALVIDSQTALNLKTKLDHYISVICKLLFSWQGLLVAVSAIVLYFLLRNLFKEQPMIQLAYNLFNDIIGFLKGRLPIIIMLIITVGLYHFFRFIGNFTHDIVPKDAFIGWSAGTVIMYLLVIMAAIYRAKIGQATDSIAANWLDIYKDYTLYFLIVVVFIGGLERWVNTCGPDTPNVAIYMIIFFVGATICALGLGMMDFIHMSNLSTSQDPTIKDRVQIIKTFIYVRDLGIIVPMCFLHAIYLLWRAIIVTSANGSIVK